jgi:hypothetical protein
VARDKVFISYSHKDADWLGRLTRVLRPLERKGLIDSWADTRIVPGRDWRGEIAAALASAHTAILLISTDFFASDFIADHELPNLLAAAATEGVEILPLIIKPSRFVREPDIARFQAFNPPDKPLAAMTEVEQDAVLDRLAVHLETRTRP